MHFPLHPETPDEGRTLEDLFAGSLASLESMQSRLQVLASEEGLPFSLRTHTYNSRRAQELAKWAEKQWAEEGCGEEGRPAPIHDALYRAYFVDDINLADPNELARIAESVGLDGGAAREVVASGRYAPAVDSDWQDAMRLGVRGVPTFMAGGRGVVGAQSFEVLEQLVQGAGARRL